MWIGAIRRIVQCINVCSHVLGELGGVDFPPVNDSGVAVAEAFDLADCCRGVKGTDGVRMEGCKSWEGLEKVFGEGPRYTCIYVFDFPGCIGVSSSGVGFGNCV